MKKINETHVDEVHRTCGSSAMTSPDSGLERRLRFARVVMHDGVLVAEFLPLDLSQPVVRLVEDRVYGERQRTLTRVQTREYAKAIKALEKARLHCRPQARGSDVLL